MALRESESTIASLKEERDKAKRKCKELRGKLQSLEAASATWTQQQELQQQQQQQQQLQQQQQQQQLQRQQLQVKQRLAEGTKFPNDTDVHDDNNDNRNNSNNNNNNS